MKQQFTKNHHLFLFTDHFFSASRRSDLSVPTSSTGAPVCRRPDNPMILASVKLCFIYKTLQKLIRRISHEFHQKPSKEKAGIHRQLMFLFEWSVLDSIPYSQEFLLKISFLSLEVLTTLVVFANHIAKTTTMNQLD